MASSQQIEADAEVELKHLGLVRVVAINAALLLTNLYDWAKDNSGPLRSTLGKLDNAVIIPLFHRFKSLPAHLLLFLDKKVDEASYKMESFAPAAKSAAIKVESIAKEALRLVQKLVEEAKVDGPVAAVGHAGRISKDVAVWGLAVASYKANQYSALKGVLEMVVPTATHFSQKYNRLVQDLGAKGYTVFTYVPLVPVEEIQRAYKHVIVEAAANNNKKTDHDQGQSSQSQSQSQSDSD